MTQAGDPGMPPFSIGWGVADQTGAVMTAYGVLAALLARERLGIGQELDVSLLGTMIFVQQMTVNSAVMLGAELARFPRYRVGNPLLNHYMCADNRWIMLGMNQADRHWPNFCRVLGIENLEKDPRFENLWVRGQNSEDLVAILDKIFPTKTSEEWIIQLRAADLVVARVNTISDLENDPQVVANDYIIEFDHPALGRKIKMVGIPVQLRQTPGSVRLPAPEFGQHTEEVLLELGYSWDEISHLKEEEVI